ncbi:MAG: hypothetical protein DBY24_10405 [Prevotellaceae bacterium]|nr:MAG: hypothetical protein DBY24_10405 [Prevotellaceae bacterium]
MKLSNEQGQAVYYNIVTKGGQIRFIVQAASGQTIPGRDREKLKSRTFSQGYQAEAFLKRLGYTTSLY